MSLEARLNSLTIFSAKLLLLRIAFISTTEPYPLRLDATSPAEDASPEYCENREEDSGDFCAGKKVHEAVYAPFILMVAIKDKTAATRVTATISLLRRQRSAMTSITRFNIFLLSVPIYRLMRKHPC